VLILAPTRDLAKQVFAVIELFVPLQPFIVPLVLTGGSSTVDDDLKCIHDNHPNILIATPGRLHELISIAQNPLFKSLELLVVDEADRIMDLGEESHLSVIFQSIPKQRRTGLFSATLNQALQEIIKIGLRNPIFLRIQTKTAIPTELNNFYCIADRNYKLAQLISFLNGEAINAKVIIFVLTGAIVDYFYEVLKLLMGESRMIYPMHGQMRQSDRDQSLEDFRASSHGILIATDVAARGIDIPDVDWILQFDPPQDHKMFVHRIGRTARIGRTGKAVIFLRDHEEAYVDFMDIQDVPMSEMVIEVPPESEQVLASIRDFSKGNEPFYRKSILAMVSYARAYGEHRLKLLLRKKEVDFVALGNSFGLVRLPVMPELKDNSAAKEYNERFSEYAEPYKSGDQKMAERAEKEKREKAAKKRKKQRTSEEENVMYQRLHRSGGFRPRQRK
jgi:ATP-dependent RNA helicase DDX55/SPB4